MKTRTFILVALTFVSMSLYSQNGNPPGPPLQVNETNMECDVVLDIYDAFVDWKSVPPVSWGGNMQALSANDKINKGAVCVANKNDTNGNGDVDWGDNNVLANPVGRNEIDMMKLVLRPRDAGVSLNGQAMLTKISGGTIRLWKTPEKIPGTQESLPLTVDVSTLPITWYIEVKEPSTTVRDIELQVSYGGTIDAVKATAVWVDLVETFDDPTDNTELSSLGVVGCVKVQIENDIASNGSKFGYGAFRYRSEFGDTKLGSRILFQWQIKPLNTNDLISIDGTRQRETSNWKLDISSPFEPPCAFAETTTLFPFNEQMDNEFPNDDRSKSNQDVDACVQTQTVDGRFFTWDVPSVAIHEEKIVEPPFPLYRAFVDDKTNFYEYVRIAPVNYNFNPIFVGPGLLLGSRASEKYAWSSAYYTKKDAYFKLDQDNSEYGHSHLRVNDPTDDISDYPISYIINQLNTSYSLGSYSAWVSSFNNEKSVILTRYEDYNNGGGCIQAETSTTQLNLSQSEYDLIFQGHSIHLTELEDLGVSAYINWHLFKSTNKQNVLIVGSHNTNGNH
ncbi:MAG: hypothetical protein R2787_16375 [Saprospiraceae bacterium]